MALRTNSEHVKGSPRGADRFGAGEVRWRGRRCLLAASVRANGTAPEVANRPKRRAGNFYTGLLIASTFAPAHRPAMLTGSRRGGEIGIRSQDDFDPAICFVATRRSRSLRYNWRLRLLKTSARFKRHH